MNTISLPWGLKPARDVVEEAERVPTLPGVYLFFGPLIELLAGSGMNDLQEDKPFTFGGQDLLYIGCAADLRSRLKTHLTSISSSGSSFRSTLGVMLAEPLALEITTRPYHPYFHFGAGEGRVSRWMQENLSVAVWPMATQDEAVELEAALIRSLAAPLCITGRRDTALGRRLLTLRARAAGRENRPRRPMNRVIRPQSRNLPRRS